MTTYMVSKDGKWRWASILLVLQTWFALTATASPFQLVSAIDPEFSPPVGGNGDSYLPVVSRDGRYVLFASTADNLVSLGTNHHPLPTVIPAPINVFLRDRTKGSTVLVSVNLDGTAGGDADSVPIGVSTNGRYALFESGADNLVPGDTNNAADVFVRDLIAGTTVLVSVGTNGSLGDDASYGSAMTPDGRYVAFTSAADNLVPGDTNGIPDVFIRDLVSNVTSLVSVGAQPGKAYSYVGSDSPVVSPDGRYVSFYSTATNLVPGTRTAGDVYLRDRVAATTIRVSIDALSLLQPVGTALDALSFSQVLSDDGRFVAFEAIPYPQAALQPALVVRYDIQSGHSDLIETNASVTPTSSFENIQNLAMTPDGRFVGYVANALDNTGSTTSIRVWDAQGDTNILASVNQTGSVSPGSLSDSPVLDDSGRFVAFVSSAPDLVTNQIPGDFHLYLRDLQTATTSLIDADTNGVGSPIDPTSVAAMSADGRVVAFSSQDGNLVPADRNHAYDAFARNLTTASTEIISAHDPGLPSLTPDGSSAISAQSLSANARFIAFWSDADDLVGNDTNGVRDIFVRDAVNGTNVLVSVSSNGVSGDGYSTDPAISDDGRYVAFTSAADDLVSGDTNRALDVFVRDLQASKTTLASINLAGTGPGNADSYSPVLSSNGQVILFHSLASDLRAGFSPRNDIDNLFWRDLASNRTYALTTNQLANKVTAASMTPDGRLVALVTGSSSVFPAGSALYVWDSASASIVYSLAGGANSFGQPAISPDGKIVAYVTNTATVAQLVAVDWALDTNWVIASYQSHSTSSPRFSADSRFLAYVGSLGSPAYTNQIYLYDFQTGSNRLVSRSYDGVSPGNDQSDSPDISADGKLIAYRSAADNLVPSDTNGLPDIFLYDGSSGSTTLITASRFGHASADNRSLMPLFSSDGRTLVFESWASDLIPGDFNNSSDVFALGLSSGPTAPPLVVTVVPMGSPSAGHWLSWPAVTGKSFRVQYKNNLNDPAWQELNGTISITGDRAGVQDGPVSATSRFYRVLAY